MEPSKERTATTSSEVTGTSPALNSKPQSPLPTLLLLAVAELLGMSLWFSGTVVSPQLRVQWQLDPAQGGWLTTIVQLGFVIGTAGAALLNLADLLPSRWYFSVSALLGALANASLLVVSGYYPALVTRFFTGLFLAGVYPPAMKMIATWYRSGRGLAIGTIVGALTVGKATPYLVHALHGVGTGTVILTASAGAITAAVLVGSAYREGPYPFPRRRFSWGLVGTVLRHRETRLATAGYLGHMWELYAMWTWIPAFLAASLAAKAHGSIIGSLSAADLLAFLTIGAGGLGCIWGGWAAERIGYERVVTIAMTVSGGCSLLIGWLSEGSLWLFIPVVLVWGFFVVADSAQFSALVTEVAPPHAVGTALTMQTSLGFLLTTVTIQLVPRLVEVVGWRWAFAVLAVGPAAGIAAIARIKRGKPNET